MKKKISAGLIAMAVVVACTSEERPSSPQATQETKDPVTTRSASDSSAAPRENYPTKPMLTREQQDSLLAKWKLEREEQRARECEPYVSQGQPCPERKVDPVLPIIRGKELHDWYGIDTLVDTSRLQSD